MTSVTLSSGDLVTFSVEGKTYTGVIKEVSQTSIKNYLVALESRDQELPIRFLHVENKTLYYLGF